MINEIIEEEYRDHTIRVKYDDRDKVLRAYIDGAAAMSTPVVQTLTRRRERQLTAPGCWLYRIIQSNAHDMVSEIKDDIDDTLIDIYLELNHEEISKQLRDAHAD